MAVDWNAPHIGFTIAAYALSALVLVLLVWSTMRTSAKREAELRKLEEQTARRKSGQRGP